MNIENLPLNNVPCTIIIDIKPSVKIPEFVVYANDPTKPLTVYYNRLVSLDPAKLPNGIKTFELKLPIAPKLLTVSLFNRQNGNFATPNADASFKLKKFEPCQLKTSPMWLTEKDKEFLLFAKQFSNNSTITDFGKKDKPCIYASRNGNFTIEYYDFLWNRQTGNPISTPSRIGEKTGIIQVAANFFNTYSVPSKVLILYHEYSHLYKNPQMGRRTTDEIAADVNALYMYLSEGFSESEAIKVFAKVFSNARKLNQNDTTNDKRMAIINDFIYKFNKGQFDNTITDYKKTS